MSRHINIDQTEQQTYQRLSEKHNPFNTMKDVFMTAAVLGYRSGGPRLPLKRRYSPFDTTTLTHHEDMPILRALAIRVTGDASAVTDEDTLFTIAEEYANVGILILKTEVLEGPGDVSTNLLSYLERQFGKDGLT